MTARPALHLLIYSELLLHGGGRETWLGYFLPMLAARRRFRALFVYHMRPGDPAQALPLRLGPCPGTPVHFLASGAGVHGARGLGAAGGRFAAFARRTLHGVRRFARPGDLLLTVGVHGEAPPTLLAWLLGRLARRRLRLVTWLREASLRLVQERRGAGVYGAMLALRQGVLALSERIVCNGEDTLAVYSRQFPRLRGRMLAIPNAVDWEHFAALPLPDLGARPLRVGFLGRLIAAKGYADFADAARRCAGAPELELLACGRPEPDAPPPPGALRLQPPVPHHAVRELLASCQAMAVLNHTRRLEMGGLSHALLEMLAAGRLVIAWDNACHRQVLHEGNAILVPEGDRAALSATLRGLPARDPAELSARAAAGRETARAYSREAHLERFLTRVVDPLLGG